MKRFGKVLLFIVLVVLALAIVRLLFGSEAEAEETKKPAKRTKEACGVYAGGLLLGISGIGLVSQDPDTLSSLAVATSWALYGAFAMDWHHTKKLPEPKVFPLARYTRYKFSHGVPVPSGFSQAVLETQPTGIPVAPFALSRGH